MLQFDLDENIELGKTQTSKEFAEAHIRAQNTYYSLVRNLIVWATVALTLTAGFADKLHKPHPACPWLLQACLGLLALTILSGVVASYGEVRLHELTVGMLFQKYQDLQSKDRKSQCAALKRVYVITNSKWFSFSFHIEIWSFVLGLLALSIFAIANF